MLHVKRGAVHSFCARVLMSCLTPLNRCLDIVEVSAKLSRKLLEWQPLRVRITKVIDKHTFETAPSAVPVKTSDDLWADDLDHAILTPEEKEMCHLKLHRGVGCDGYVHAFAEALRQLCDSGVPLTYENDHVVDIWVMNTVTFDVSDIPSTSILNLRDPISGITVRALSTYEDQDLLRSVGEVIRRRVGLQAPEATALDVAATKRDTKSAPHWWVAAIVEGQSGRHMVHLDVCGAAYEESGFRRQDGDLVSLQVFTTPEYYLVPGKSIPKNRVAQDISHKFLMQPTVATSMGRMQSLQPLSIRHLRSFHNKDHSCVEVTPLETFLHRRNNDRTLSTQCSQIVADLRNEIVLRAPPGFEFLVCNLKTMPELNGRIGQVHECVVSEPPTDRVPVWIEGVGNPAKLKPSCLRIMSRKRYSSFEEILRRVQSNSVEGKDVSNPLPKKTVSKPMPMKARAALKKALQTDPEISDSWATLMTGKVTISFYADERFVRGVRKLCAPRFEAALPAPMLTAMRDSLAIADHPKAMETFKILRMCKAAKLRAVEENPAILHGDGGVEVHEDSDFFQVIFKAAESILNDPGLTEVFNLMDRKRLFPSPVRQLAVLSS